MTKNEAIKETMKQYELSMKQCMTADQRLSTGEFYQNMLNFIMNSPIFE